MQDFKLGAVESRFADLIWLHAPITTSELVKLCAQELSWKRTTTYTVLKRLCERGLFQTQDSVVTPLLSRTEFYARQSEHSSSRASTARFPHFSPHSPPASACPRRKSPRFAA